MKNKTLQNIAKEPAVAYKLTQTPLDLVSLTRRGLRKQALTNLGDLLSLTTTELASLLPVTKRTIQRKKPGDFLSTAASEQIILISELTDKGIETFGNIKPFKKWLKTENTALNGHKPLSLLDTAIGIQLVDDVLMRLSHGVYS